MICQPFKSNVFLSKKTVISLSPKYISFISDQLILILQIVQFLKVYLYIKYLRNGDFEMDNDKFYYIFFELSLIFYYL